MVFEVTCFHICLFLIFMHPYMHSQDFMNSNMHIHSKENQNFIHSNIHLHSKRETQSFQALTHAYFHSKENQNYMHSNIHSFKNEELEVSMQSYMHIFQANEHSKFG